ncbi:MAG: flagellar export chaperone FlgN, partial [Actinomycetota bacterium]
RRRRRRRAAAHRSQPARHARTDPVIRPAAARLAAALDEAASLQEALIALITAQRGAIAAGRVDEIERIGRDVETTALRLGTVEDARQHAAAELADQLGLAATRWSHLRGALQPAEVAALDPRVARLEARVRDLELANSINGQLLRRELDLVDYSIRGLLTTTQAPQTPRYTAGGRLAARPDTAPILLNTTA